ncbi:MAG: APC family permease [Erysipelotrichaceae bacterium]
MNEKGNGSNTQKRKFGLLTTVAMIVGIVVGSGIFFKTPQILMRVNGNVSVGIAVFFVAAIGIIFGGLTISQYAHKDENVGGIISYCEMAWGKTVGYIAGWFQTVFYFPAICAVIAWVAANYTCALFGLPNLLVNGQFGPEVWILAIVYLFAGYLLNAFATVNAGKFQNAAMFIKMGALIVLAGGGILFGDPVKVIEGAAAYHTNSSGFLSALVIVVFAFDGWMIAPSIAHEIKNPKRNLPLALTMAPLIVTGIYLAYFIGVTALAGPDMILQGHDPLQFVATTLFGPMGMKIVMVFVIISVLGTLNGIILGYIRLPYALALRGEIQMSETLSKVNKKYDIPFASAIFTLVMSLIWLALHWLSIDGANVYGMSIFAGLEVDNLPIVSTYIFNGLLYLAVIIKGVEGRKLNVVQRYVFPILALVGAGLVIYGGVIQPKFNVYFFICILGILAGIFIRPKQKTSTKMDE